MKTRIIKILALAGALLTLSGCGAKAAPDLRQVLQTITEQTEQPPMAELSDKRMMDRCGFSTESMPQAIVLTSRGSSAEEKRLSIILAAAASGAED